MSTTTKPIKSAEELVALMQNKGITFNIVSPQDAADSRYRTFYQNGFTERNKEPW